MALLFENASANAVTILLILCTCVYFYFKYKFSYWKRRGVKYIPATSPLGNLSQTFMQKMQMGEEAEICYHKTTEPFIGIYASVRPVLLLRDPEILRHILIKDFQHFVDRGVHADEKNDPVSAHMFSLTGDRWRNLRVKLTPTFTSGKLKAMFSALVDCGVPLQKHMHDSASKNETIEIREITAQYTTSVIASVAFGADINCIDNPDTPFRKYGRQFFATNLKNGLRFAAMFLFPKILEVFKIRLIDQHIEDFMMALVTQTLEYREKNNIVRKDFFQLLVQLRNTGNVQLDDEWETVITADEKGKKLTIAEMTAQSFLFYIAGFETTASAITFALFEIARNAEIQRKIHEEIDETLAKHNGQITYESASEMKYLESCIDETLRKYPPIALMVRECTKDYKMPDTDIVIEKGTAIFIPALALHRDEKYFPDPLKFNPDRFSGKNSAPPMSYLPFGEGPRNCIGMRLGKMQTKVGLILMMQHCRFELGDPQYHNKELPIAPAAPTLAPTGGIRLKISPR